MVFSFRARSVIHAFRELGYSALYASEHAAISEIWRAIPDLVQIVITGPQRPESLQVLSQDDIRQGASIIFVEAEAAHTYLVTNHTLAEWTKIEKDGQTDPWQKPIFYGYRKIEGHSFPDTPNDIGLDSLDIPSSEKGPPAYGFDFPQGIPRWKILNFQWWAQGDPQPLEVESSPFPALYAMLPRAQSTMRVPRRSMQNAMKEQCRMLVETDWKAVYRERLDAWGKMKGKP
jgi:hypothetical protein